MGSGLPGSVPGPEGWDAGTHSISVPQRSVRPFTGVPLPVTLSHAPSRYQRQGPTHDRLTVLNPGFLMSGGVRARRTSVYLKRVPSGCRCHRTCGRSGARSGRRGGGTREERFLSWAWGGKSLPSAGLDLHSLRNLRLGDSTREPTKRPPPGECRKSRPHASSHRKCTSPEF